MLAVALVALIPGQVDDLSRMPELDKPLTLKVKNGLIIPTLRSILDKTGVSFSFNPDTVNSKITIMVKGAKTSDVLRHTLEMLNIYCRIDGKTLRLRRPRPDLQWDFFIKEQAWMDKRMLAKLYALRDETKKPFSGDLNGPTIYTPGKDNETPEEWAKRKVTEPSYYALGMMMRTNEGARWQGPARFKVSEPETRLNVSMGTHGIDQNSSVLKGHQILVRYLDHAGDLQVVNMRGGARAQNDVNKLPYVWAQPIKELASHPFAKALQEWETPLQGFDVVLRKRRLDKQKAIEDPGYFGGRISLAEKLEELHEKAGMQIIADSFRTPTQTPRAEAETVEEYLKHLKEKEDCFLRFAGGLLLVRHPAFWRFADGEPVEEPLAWADEVSKTRRLTLDDYGYVARRMIVDGANTGASERFLNQSRTLTRFDPTPLIESFPALVQYGELTVKERALLWSGAPLHAGFNFCGRPRDARIVDRASPSGWGRANIPYYDVHVAPFYEVTTHGRVADLYMVWASLEQTFATTTDEYWTEGHVNSWGRSWPWWAFWAESDRSGSRVVMTFGECAQDAVRYVIKIP
jgi:hypothetical protein